MADLSGIWLWSMAALWLLVLVEAFLTFAVLRQLGIVYNSLPRRPPPLSAVDPGTPVGDFDLPELGGNRVRLQHVLNELQTPWLVLTFVSPECSACRALLESLSSFVGPSPFGYQPRDQCGLPINQDNGRMQFKRISTGAQDPNPKEAEADVDEGEHSGRAMASQFQLLVISRGDMEQTRILTRGLQLPSVQVAVEGSYVFERDGIGVTPYVFVIDRQGQLRAKGGANTLQDLFHLVN